jgi:hypothetical protein
VEEANSHPADAHPCYKTAALGWALPPS